MKKALSLLAFAPLAVFAEGATGSTGSAANVEAVTSAMETWGGQIETFFSAALPYIIGLMGLGVAVVALFIGWKLFKRGTSKVG